MTTTTRTIHKTCGGFAITATNDGAPMWECQNCSVVWPRRVLASRTLVDAHGLQMTPRQVQAIARIRAEGWARNTNGGLSETEEKEFIVTYLRNGRSRPTGERLSVVAAYGNPNDEGTLAAIMCRDRGHFFISTGGGIEIAGVGYGEEYKGKVRAARRYPLIYGWH